MLLRNDGTSDVLDQHDLLLGIDPGYSRDEHVIGLHPHDTLLMFTDGLVERRGEHFDDGLDRLRTRLNDLRNLPLRTMVDQLLTHLIPDPHEDDVAILALRPRAS